MFRSEKARQMTTPIQILTPTVGRVNGVKTKTFPESGTQIFCNWSSYGGTETTVDGTLSIEDTAQIVTWYNPEITSGARVKRMSDNAVFDILGDPENVEMRNMIMSFKVRRVKGGA